MKKNLGGRPKVERPPPLPKELLVTCPHCRVRNVVPTRDAIYAKDRPRCSECGTPLP